MKFRCSLYFFSGCQTAVINVSVLKWLCLSMLFCCFGGCSSGSREVDRFPIDGEIRYGNQPVVSGSITLEPDTTQGNLGPSSTAMIENSRFSIPASRGIVGGPYRVQITGYGSPPESTGADVNYGKSLFSEYEILVDLPAKSSSQVFEVKPR